MMVQTPEVSRSEMPAAFPLRATEEETLTGRVLAWGQQEGMELPTIRDVEDSYRAALVVARDSGRISQRSPQWKIVVGQVLTEYVCDVLMLEPCSKCPRAFARAARLMGGGIAAVRILTFALGSDAAARWDDPCEVVPYAAAIYRRKKEGVR